MCVRCVRFIVFRFAFSRTLTHTLSHCLLLSLSHTHTHRGSYRFVGTGGIDSMLQQELEAPPVACGVPSARMVNRPVQQTAIAHEMRRIRSDLLHQILQHR